MSDERDGAGSAGVGTEAGTGNEAAGESRGQTAVVTRPVRPTGKRSRRGAVTETDLEDTAAPDSKTAVSKNGVATAKKTAKEERERPNPLAFVWNYLKQVVAELRKVIWPNRKQMVSYTTVVLIFLTFMVALIYGADFGLTKLVSLVFGG